MRPGHHRSDVSLALALLALLASSCTALFDPDALGRGAGGGGDGGGAPAGAGGTGGAGSACAQPSDCPGLETACQQRSCERGVCGVTYAPVDTIAPDDGPGDCKRLVCDGRGGTKGLDDDSDVFDDANECTHDVCDGGDPKNAPEPPGSVCAQPGGTLCNGAGACVECLTASDCPAAFCSQNECVPLPCNDGIKNGAETGTDCGGFDCAPCGDGEPCGVDADCTSKVCSASLCAAPTCRDGRANGQETDVDCGGGACPACAPGEGCADDDDCIGGRCTGSTCAPTCVDGVENGLETDVDCGGPVCTGCPFGKGCKTGMDCLSGSCPLGQCF